MVWYCLHTYPLPYLHMYCTSWAGCRVYGRYMARTTYVHCVSYEEKLLYGKIMVYRQEISVTPKKPRHNTVKIAVKFYFPSLTMMVKSVELRNLIRFSACAVWHGLMFCGVTGPAIKLLQALVRTNQFTSIDVNSAMTGYTIEMWS